jgi:hypothetical protein
MDGYRKHVTLPKKRLYQPNMVPQQKGLHSLIKGEVRTGDNEICYSTETPLLYLKERHL